ncbi:MAG TPA: FAD-dependent monooxygenase [Polyangiaceae bacterium]|jgi:2-polyprenyl-6-methoxyphenol hydroxylase-like FAD-dependent oxidoreductase|nr:FAD-dependent monooxygenase [Polyangiaceae bacterium]
MKLERILIVGGGIGGLSVAIALRAVGFQVEVLEQAQTLREVGAGVGLWSNAMASLDQLGAGAAVRRTCTPLRMVAGLNAEGATITAMNLDQLGPEFADAACFIALRPALLAALAERIPKECVRTEQRVARVEPREEAVRVHFADGHAEEADLLIGADGLHSVVRELVAGPDAIRYSGQTCFRGVARVATQTAALCEIQGRGQRGAVCPVDGETVYWWTAHNSPEGQLYTQEARRSFLLDRYRGWPQGLAEAIAATPAEAILQNDLVDRPPTKRYARGRVVLVGDAAHPTTPNLGQGANMAIDDAIVLARALRDENSVEAAFDRYRRERLSRTRKIVERSWSFGRMCCWDSAVAVRLREALLRATPRRVMRDALRWQILEGVGALTS